MTELKGTNSTIADSPTPSTLLDPGKWGGRVRAQHDVYETSSTPQGDTIQIATVPKGALVMPQSSIAFDALGSNTALSVGTVASPAKYIASTATTSAGQLFFNLVDGSGDQMTADTDIIITVSGSGAATGTIRSCVMYSYA
jgi:hypothetical protein